MSSVFVTCQGVSSILLEFCGDEPEADIDIVSAAIKHAIDSRYVYAIGLQDEDSLEGPMKMLVNFAACPGVLVRDHDPRLDADWEERPTITNTVVAFLHAVLVDSANRAASSSDAD